MDAAKGIKKRRAGVAKANPLILFNIARKKAIAKAHAAKKKPAVEFTLKYNELTDVQKQKYVDQAATLNAEAAAKAAAAAARADGDDDKTAESDDEFVDAAEE